MNEPRSLDSLFKETRLRVPDDQRGCAWQIEQLKARPLNGYTLANFPVRRHGRSQRCNRLRCSGVIVAGQTNRRTLS